MASSISGPEGSAASRARVLAALEHRQPDRVPVDFGSTSVTGIHASCVAALRDYFGLEARPVKVHEPYQMLGWIDDDLQTALGIDVEGAYGPNTMFGYRNENWQPWRMDDGTEVLMSGNFRTTKDLNGDTLVYPGGDRSAPPSGRLPKNGFFFDTIVRQEPVDGSGVVRGDRFEDRTVLVLQGRRVLVRHRSLLGGRLPRPAPFTVPSRAGRCNRLPGWAIVTATSEGGFRATGSPAPGPRAAT